MKIGRWELNNVTELGDDIIKYECTPKGTGEDRHYLQVVYNKTTGKLKSFNVWGTGKKIPNSLTEVDEVKLNQKDYLAWENYIKGTLGTTNSVILNCNVTFEVGIKMNELTQLCEVNNFIRDIRLMLPSDDKFEITYIRNKGQM